MTGQKIAIDIGSANITVYVGGKGIVICEPSCIVVDAETEKIIAKGVFARRMEGRLPSSMKIIYPIKNGLINDYDRTVNMLRYYFSKLCKRRIFRPNVLMCVPGVVTELEKKTIFDAVIEAGAGRACFVDQALASAAGAGIDLASPKGTLICDIGASTTDCAAIASGNIILSDYRSIGGNNFNLALKDYVMKNYNAEISDTTAEELKKTLGSAIERPEEVAILVCGKDIFNFKPRNFEVTSKDIINAFRTPLNEICDSIRYILENISPELCGDILDNGIILTGGTAGLYGLDKLITEQTGVKTIRAESPELCAALGMGKLLEDLPFLTKHDYVFRDTENDTVTDE